MLAPFAVEAITTAINCIGVYIATSELEGSILSSDRRKINERFEFDGTRKQVLSLRIEGQGQRLFLEHA